MRYQTTTKHELQVVHSIYLISTSDQFFRRNPVRWGTCFLSDRCPSFILLRCALAVLLHTSYTAHTHTGWLGLPRLSTLHGVAYTMETRGLEARHPKSKCPRGRLLLRAVRSPWLWTLSSLGVTSHTLPSLSTSVFESPPAGRQHSYRPRFIGVTSLKALPSNTITERVRVRTSTSEFWGDTVQPDTSWASNTGKRTSA